MYVRVGKGRRKAKRGSRLVYNTKQLLQTYVCMYIDHILVSLWLLRNAKGSALRLFPLAVHVSEDHGDIGGEEIVHLIAEARLTEEPASSNQTPDCDVEVVGATAPVGDLGERVGSQNFLEKKRTKMKIMSG